MAKKIDRRRWWTLGAVCAATFMLLLDITIVNAALPPIQVALSATFSDLQWVVDAYALALATIVLNAGSLADRYGRKKLFILGVAIFTLASAVCGAATTSSMLIAARAIQGIGGGIMFATSLSLLAQDFHFRLLLNVNSGLSDRFANKTNFFRAPQTCSDQHRLQPLLHVRRFALNKSRNRFQQIIFLKRLAKIFIHTELHRVITMFFSGA